jgi:protein-disulfide isomerase
MRPKFTILPVLLLLTAKICIEANSRSAVGQQPADSPTARSQGITQDQAAAILDELRQIRHLLERTNNRVEPTQAARPPAEETAHIEVGSAMILGRTDAPVTLVEFTDLQCPYCQKFHLGAFEQIKEKWIATGKLRFVSRDFPLDLHDQAMPAALAVRCAGEQQRFWEMRHTLLVNGANLRPEIISALARTMDLDMDRFMQCVAGEKFRADVEADIDAGRTAGISGTPTFVIGRTTSTGVDGVKIVGAQPYAAFETRIQELLAE